MAKPMTKTQLVAALAEEMGADKKTASAALDAITGVITSEVSGGGVKFLARLTVYCEPFPCRSPKQKNKCVTFNSSAQVQ